jgi:hypothetical protein
LLRLVVQLVSGLCAGLGSDNGRGNNHSDKSKGNQEIMHLSSPGLVQKGNLCPSGSSAGAEEL